MLLTLKLKSSQFHWLSKIVLSDFLYKPLSTVPLGTKNTLIRERSIVHPSRSMTSMVFPSISVLFVFFLCSQQHF